MQRSINEDPQGSKQECQQQSASPNGTSPWSQSCKLPNGSHRLSMSTACSYRIYNSSIIYNPSMYTSMQMHIPSGLLIRFWQFGGILIELHCSIQSSNLYWPSINCKRKGAELQIAMNLYKLLTKWCPSDSTYQGSSRASRGALNDLSDSICMQG